MHKYLGESPCMLSDHCVHFFIIIAYPETKKIVCLNLVYVPS